MDARANLGLQDARASLLQLLLRPDLLAAARAGKKREGLSAAAKKWECHFFWPHGSSQRARPTAGGETPLPVRPASGGRISMTRDTRPILTMHAPRKARGVCADRRRKGDLEHVCDSPRALPSLSLVSIEQGLLLPYHRQLALDLRALCHKLRGITSQRGVRMRWWCRAGPSEADGAVHFSPASLAGGARRCKGLSRFGFVSILGLNGTGARRSSFVRRRRLMAWLRVPVLVMAAESPSSATAQGQLDPHAGVAPPGGRYGPVALSSLRSHKNLPCDRRRRRRVPKPGKQESRKAGKRKPNFFSSAHALKRCQKRGGRSGAPGPPRLPSQVTKHGKNRLEKKTRLVSRASATSQPARASPPALC